MTGKGSLHLPNQTLFQVQFPLRIVGVRVAADLHVSPDLHLARTHPLDRVGRVLPSSQRAREDPLLLTHLLEVVLLEPLPRFVPVPFLAPAPEHAEDPMIHLRGGAVARGMTMVHGPAFDLL